MGGLMWKVEKGAPHPLTHSLLYANTSLAVNLLQTAAPLSHSNLVDISHSKFPSNAIHLWIDERIR